MLDDLILYLNWQAYAFVLIPIMVHWLIFPSKRAVSTGILNWFNMIILVVGLVMIFNSSLKVWAYYPELGTDKYPWSLFWGFVLRLILLVGLFVKNARKSIAFSLVIAISTLLNPLIISITNFHRDYTEFSGVLDHFNPIWYQISSSVWQGMSYLSLAIVLYLMEQKRKP